MNLEHKGWRLWPSVLPLLIILSVTLAANGEKPARRGSQREFYPNDGIRPQLLNADTDPTLRYPIASFSGWSVASTSYGWFDVTRKGIRYSVVQPQSKTHEGFMIPTGQLSEIKTFQTYITFREPSKKHMIFYLPQERWGSIHSGPGSMQAASAGALGTASILQALNNFDSVLAMVTPPPVAPPPVVAQPVVSPPPEPTPATPPAPPAIVLSAPSGAGANQVIEADESPLVVRGVTMDASGLPVVTINGTPVNMRPQSPQAAEFWSDPLPLQPGGNRFEISASNAAHVAAKLVFIVHFTPKMAPQNPRALSKQDIVALLEGGVPSLRTAEIIKERGIKFAPTAGDLNDIRAAGGSDEVVQAIQQAAPAGH